MVAKAMIEEALRYIGMPQKKYQLEHEGNIV